MSFELYSIETEYVGFGDEPVTNPVVIPLGVKRENRRSFAFGVYERVCASIDQSGVGVRVSFLVNGEPVQAHQNEAAKSAAARNYGRVG